MWGKRISNLNRNNVSLASNSAWLIGEKILTGVISVLVTAVVARYLGPNDFGILAYTFAVASLFAIVGQLGLDGLVVRELVAKPDQHPVILGTVTTVKFIAYGIAALGVLAFGFFSNNNSDVGMALFIFAALFVLVQSLHTPMAWFHSRVEGRYVSLSLTGGVVASNALKILLVIAGAQLLWFGAAYLVAGIVSLALGYLFFKYRNGPRLTTWNFDRRIAVGLLRESGMILIGSFATIIFLKIDQIMLSWMTDNAEVGRYAVASQLSEACYIIPTAIVASLFPRLISSKKISDGNFDDAMQKLLNINSIAASVVVITVLIAAPFIIPILFGSQYQESIAILQIHILAAPFIFCRVAISRWVLIEHKYKQITIYQVMGAVINIALNFVLIPRLGGMGAAIATLASYCFAGYLSMALHVDTRNIFKMATRALLFPYIALFQPRKTLNLIKSIIWKNSNLS